MREAGGTNEPLANCPLITAKSRHSFIYEKAKPKTELGDFGEIKPGFANADYKLKPAS